MQFACIQVCSVCPFGCRRGFSVPSGGTVVNNPIPQVIQESKPIEPEESAENEILTVPDSENPVEEYVQEENNAIQEAQNLPVLSDVQYTVSDDNRKGLKRLFKR